MYKFFGSKVPVAAAMVLLASEVAIAQVSGGNASGHKPARGQALYAANCSACHQADGAGLRGAFPPLKGSGVVNKDDASKHMQVVLDGMQGGKAGGVVYASTMPPFRAVLKDADIASIINYERGSWGNHGKPVTAAQVAAERSKSQPTNSGAAQ